MLAIDEEGVVLFANHCCAWHFPNLGRSIADHALLGRVLTSARRLKEERREWDSENFSADGFTYKALIRHDAENRRYHVFLSDVSVEMAIQRQFFEVQKRDSINNLTSGIAHDLNNYVSIILSICYLMKSEPDGATAGSEDVAEIESAALNAASLIKQLLDYGKKTGGFGDVTNVNSAFDEIRSILKCTVGEERTLVIDGDPSLPGAAISGTELKQVLVNLVINARDATPAGGLIQVEARAARGDERTHPECLRISVSDSGAGIPKENLRKVFEPYFTTKQKNKGTGLGLAACQEIIKRNGGSIAVESKLGEGTRFTLYVPSSRRADAAPEAKDAVGPYPFASVKTVLVAEDDRTVLRALEKLLTRYGYRVLTADNGMQAYAILRSTVLPIDLLLTDGMMPRMSGFSLAKVVQKEYPDLPVLCLTGSDNAMVLRELADNPALSVVRKPVVAEEILASIQEKLQKGSHERAIAANL